MKEAKTLYLLDGHSLAHRAFYALPLLQNSRGEYTNAVFGFARMLFRLLDKEKIDYLVVVFDEKAPTFRHQEYDAYKAKRKKMPAELAQQLPSIKELLAALNIKVLVKEGYEADDIIGTLARKGEERGLQVRIVTGDRDAFQLVTEQINVIYTKKGITSIEHYDLPKVKERYQLTPPQLVDLKGLMGDSSDNIPGVPGIGEKTAIKLLKEFNSLEGVLANIEAIPGKKRQENLRKYAEQARLSKKLGTIMLDVPLELDFEEYRLKEPKDSEIVPLLKRLEFSSLLDRFKKSEKLSVQEISLREISSEEELGVLAAKAKAGQKMALDLILDQRARPVQAQAETLVIALNEKEAYYLPAAKSFLEGLREILESSEINKYILHAKETMLVLRKLGIYLEGLVFDPLLAAYLLHPADTLPSLEEQLKKELNLVLPEDLSPVKRVAYFLTVLYPLQEKLFQQMAEKDLLKLYQELELPLIKVLVEMELNGIKVNQDYLKTLSEKWEQELKGLSSKIYQLAGEEFNLNSPKQLGEILFKKLGLPVIKKTKTGYSTSAQVLEALEGKHAIIPLIMEYRQLMKLKSTYVDALPPLINPVTKRIHTSFNQMVTATGRLSSTDPNLQNIPIRTEEGREIRKAFIPGDENWLLLAADYSQVELRVLAVISQDENLLEAFRTGKDIHTQTAAEVFEVSPEEVTPNMRRHAKVINFGIAYGMSPYGLARDLNISREEAEEYINKYFTRFPGVKRYMDQVIAEAREKGFVTTLFKRRRYIPEIRSRNYHRRSFAERTAINTPIQGSAADIMKMAMLKLAKRLQESNLEARILLQVHDELVLEVASRDLQETAALVKAEMEGAVQLEVPLTVDLQVGTNWRDKENYEVE